MSRNRANIEPGQTAYVGDLRFGPGQLLPEGTTEYQVKTFAVLEPGDGQPDGVRGIPLSVLVPVGTPGSLIQEMIESAAEAAINDAYTNFQETDTQLTMEIFDEYF